MMHLSGAHTALAPITEAGSGSGLDQPRKSIRNSQGAFIPWVRARRLTLAQQQQQQQPRFSTIDAVAAAAVAAAGGGRLRKPSRRASSLRSASDKGAAGLLQQPPARLENTYRIGPKQAFQVEAAELLLAERLSSMLHSYQYSSKSASEFSKNLAQDIKNRIRHGLGDSTQRYKLVVLVSIMDPSVATGLMASRGLWSSESGDACAQAEFRTIRVAAQATVYAFYYE